MAKELKDPTRACRPFDSTRTGFVMAEGGGSMILESLEHAQARGAHIYAEVLGYALNNDAYHMSSSLPEGESAIESMCLALDEAGLKPEQIDYINAHASSTPMNDGTEAKAVTKLFGFQDAGHQRHQALLRPRARRLRRHRGGHLHTRDGEQLGSPHAQLPRAV